jgi:16S rRNA (cytosine1407-C5)-methyltransferase
MKRKAKKSARPLDLPPDPQQELEKYRSLLDPAEFELLSREIDQPLVSAIRINPLKVDAVFPQHLRQKYGWQLEPISYCPTGFRVLASGSTEVSAALEHKLGMFYIQEAASMLPVELFSIPENEDELCLDLAASPGGKTTHLISRLRDRGLVIANDSSQGRIPALRIVLQNWGAVGCAVTRFPGESYGAWFPQVFDKVLLDAPCSMQGLRVSESHALRPVTEKESSQLSIRQTALLASALQTARIGGEVVYSTCTLLPEEDEGVIDNILARFGSSVKLLNAQTVLPMPAPGISRAADRQFAPGMESTIRLWPHRYHTAGFFACILQKTDSIDLPSAPPPAHDMERAGFVEMTGKETAAFCRQFEAQFGYGLASYLETARRVLVRREMKVFLFPSLLLELFRGLPVQSAGLLLGEDTPDGFLPSHEWVSRFGKDCHNNTYTLTDADAGKWFNGENLEIKITPEKTNSNYLILMDQHRQVLGRGKFFAGGIKNLLPRRLI